MAEEGRTSGSKNIKEVTASVATAKAAFQEIVKSVKELQKEGKTAKEIYGQYSQIIENNLKNVQQTSKDLKTIKDETIKILKNESLSAEQRDNYAKTLNKAVSLEKQLASAAESVKTAVVQTFQEEQRAFRLKEEAGKKEINQLSEKLEKGKLAGTALQTEARLKQEGLQLVQREKEEQQQLRDQIKEGNARRTEEVKAFEARRREFANKRKARLKEIGQLERKQEQDRVAAAKAQLEIDLKMSKRGKMTLEQRRDLQKRLVAQFRENYDQQSADYKKLTLRLLRIDESFEKQIGDRDRRLDKGRQDYAKKEEQRQIALNNARRRVFRAEIDLSKMTASKKIDAVNTYYNSELRNLRILGKENTDTYKNLYAEQLRLLKKYNKEKESEDKKAASKAGTPSAKPRTSFLGGLRQGFDAGDLGKSIGRLTGIGTAVSALRKTFQLLQRAITGSFQAAVDFEAQLAQLQAVTGINNQELARLEKNVLDVAGSTKFTSEEIVQLQTELGKLGFSVDEIEAATLSVARTAQALGEQVGPVAQRIGQILNQFNLSAAETTRVSDSLVSVINSSALSFEGFSTALQYIGPLGAEVGTTFEETAVAMALLADNGFTASRVGTGLRGILTELSTTGKDLNTVVEDLADNEITLAEAVDLVGKRNAAQLITLVEAAKAQKELGGTLDDLNNKYFNQGSAAIAAAQQVDTFQGNLDLLRSAVNRVQIAFGNFLKTSKLLRIALKFIDEEGYNAALAAEAIAGADPKTFSDGLETAAENVGKLKRELTDAAEVEAVAREEAAKLIEESIMAPLREELRLAYEKEELYQASIRSQIADAQLARDNAKTFDERVKAQSELNRLTTLQSQYTQEERDLNQNINDIKERIRQREEEGFESQIDYVAQLITEAGVQNALEGERNDVITERKAILESLQDQRDDEIKTLKQANDFNDKVNAQNVSVQESINALLAEQKRRKDEGNEITGEELLLFNAKLEQYKQERASLANIVVSRGELEKLAQKEFEKEFKQLSNKITLRRQELANQQALLEVQIQTQANLAKNAATEEERLAASERLSELQQQRYENERQAFEDLDAIAKEYEDTLFSMEEGVQSVAREIARAELDDRFLQKAEERLKSFELSFKELDINFEDIASATEELGDALAKTFKDKLSDGIPLDSSDKAAIDTALKELILSLFPAIEDGSEEFNELFSILKPLLLSNLIPDPEALKKDAKEKLDKIKKIIQDALSELADAAKEYNQTALQNTQGRLDAELDAIKRRYQVEEDILKSQLQNQLITESQYRAKQKELQQKQLQEENDFNKKKFEADKQADLINVGIETAEALASNIIENFKSFDSITAAGLTAAGNFTILGAGALKADAIRRRQFFPVKYEEGGMVVGPSHAEGGVPFTVQGRGGYEMEGGEFIVNKKAASLHRNLLEKINSSYKVPTSPSSYKFAAGGMVTAKADESVDYLKAIAEATTSTAISTSKPVRAYVSSKDLRSNENERRLRDRNDKI